MVKLLDYLAGLFAEEADPNGAHPTAPWPPGLSILDHVQAHIDPETGVLQREGLRLPDDERLVRPTEMDWAPGANEGVIGHHMDGDADPARAQAVAEALTAYCEAPSDDGLARLYDLLCRPEVLSFVDAAIETIGEEDRIDAAVLFELMLWFAQKAPDRGPVKFALAVLGHAEGADLTELFSTLGRHEEFTVYAAVALMNHLKEPEPALWHLAKRVEGWGRIETVGRLGDWPDTQFRDWLLREGYRNTVDDGYLAHLAATHGDLVGRLRMSGIDDDLLDAAGSLIVALLYGGPREDIADYEDAVAAVELFLDRLSERPMTLRHLITVCEIGAFLEDVEQPWPLLTEQGWTPYRRSALAERLAGLTARPDWEGRIARALDPKADAETFRIGLHAAEGLGLAVWDALLARLDADPKDETLWLRAADIAQAADIEALVEAAARVLPAAAAVRPGPPGDPARPATWDEWALGHVLQGLRRFPGHGEGLVVAGLGRPVALLRQQALETCAAWGRAAWSEALETRLVDHAEDDPDVETRRMASAVLSVDPEPTVDADLAPDPDDEAGGNGLH